MFLSLFGRGQEPANVTVDPARKKVTSEHYNRNVAMTALYKELQHFSNIAPFGEIGSRLDYVFSADINPLFIFSNSIRSRWNFGVGARVLARMFRDSSLPIRTPSYMPTVKLFYGFSNRPERYRFADLSFTHHSNGQEGPTKINGEWNERNGDFATNWVTLGFNWGNNTQRWRSHYNVYFRQHTSLFGLFGQGDSLEGYYGQTRIGFDVQRRKIENVRVVNRATRQELFAYDKERFRWHASAAFILRGLDKYPDAVLERRINAELHLYYFLKTLREGGFFFGGGYYGEDPYNIFFHRNYFFFRFGLAAGYPLFRVNNDSRLH